MHDRQSLVYLTADSDVEIQELDEGKVYIVGGLVDHNRLQFITLNKAEEQGIATAKLPLSHFVALKSSTVLAVNHCVDILLKYQATKDWAESFKCIPSRKVNNLEQE